LRIWQKKSIRVGAIIVIIVTAVVATMIIKAQKIKQTPLKIIPENVDVQVKNVVFTDVGAEGAKWEIRADLGTYIRKENKAVFDNVKVKLVLSDGRTFQMTGDKGVLETESKNMHILGHVVILSDRGDRITSDELHYTDAEKTFKTESTVFFKNKRLELQGRGMNMFLTTKELKLLSEVKATIKPKH
jgi:LPS export ABC transporter protein LptC